MAASKTKYHVLKGVGENTFETLDEVEAHSSDSAMRAVAKKLPASVLEAGVVLVAVPLSNWSEERVSVVTPEPVLRIGGQVTIEEAVAEVEAEEETA
jgi:hypothetical protein